jgi:hypothetical protein
VCHCDFELSIEVNADKRVGNGQITYWLDGTLPIGKIAYNGRAGAPEMGKTAEFPDSRGADFGSASRNATARCR